MIQASLFMDNLYILDDGRVRQFLFIGDKEALLMDAGFEDSYVLEAVRNLTNLPITVIMTHGDPDHAGGLKDFGKCFLHPADWNLISGSTCLSPLKEGDIFECGGFRLETIEIPGHTWGSTAFIDRSKKLLFPGDSVQKDGPIFLFGPHRNLDLYIKSQQKLAGLAGQIEQVLPCHHDCPIDPCYIERNLQDAIALKNSRLPGAKHPSLPCWSYQGTWTEFYYPEPGK